MISRIPLQLAGSFFFRASLPLWLLSACATGAASYSECHVLVTAEDHYHCAYAAYDHRDYRVAIREFSAAIDLKPEYKYAFNMRGLAYKYDHQYDAAIADFDTVVRLDPSDASAYTNRGLVRDRQGDYEAALLDYAEAIRIEPSFADAYYNRAIILRHDGDLTGAIRDFDEAVRFYGEAAHGPSPRVHAWFSNGRYGELVPPETKLRAIDRYLADAYYYRGSVYQRLGDQDRADADLLAARGIDPSVDERLADVLE